MGGFIAQMSARDASAIQRARSKVRRIIGLGRGLAYGKSGFGMEVLPDRATTTHCAPADFLLALFAQGLVLPIFAIPRSCIIDKS